MIFGNTLLLDIKFNIGDLDLEQPLPEYPIRYLFQEPN